MGVSLLGRSSVPRHGLAVIAFDAVATGLVSPAQLRLRDRLAPLRQHPELGDVQLGDVHVDNVGRRRLDRHRLHRRRPAQVVLPKQRLILVRTLLPIRRLQHPRPNTPEQRQDLQWLVQVRQQRRRVRAVPARPGRRRRRRVRHQRLVPQQGLVELPELPPLTLRLATVRYIDRASGLFRHASRITSRSRAPTVDTSRSSSVTVS